MNAMQKLYIAILAIFTNFYDLYINPTPKMVTLKNAKVNEDGTVEDVTLENMAKVKKNFEEWKAKYRIDITVPVGVNIWTPLFKFNTHFLVYSSRFSISGMTGNFVFGGVFDFICSHYDFHSLHIVNVSNYGKIKLKIDYDVHGNGYMSILRQSGDMTIADLFVSIENYNGTTQQYMGEIPTQENIFITEVIG